MSFCNEVLSIDSLQKQIERKDSFIWERFLLQELHSVLSAYYFISLFVFQATPKTYSFPLQPGERYFEYKIMHVKVKTNLIKQQNYKLGNDDKFNRYQSQRI